MTANPATDWLDAQFEQLTHGRKGRYRYAPGHPKWHGPDQIRPMIELLTVMDAWPPDAGHPPRLRRSRPAAAVTTRPPDYYALLGVEPDATTAQIKKAYRTLARLHHPDTNPGDPQAAVRFRQITDAYDTLTDPARRAAYDRTRPQTTATGTKLAESHPDNRAASLLVQVLEDTWLAIRCHHPDIPAVVIILAGGTETRQPRWGHFASARWYVEHTERAEVMISGEALRLTPAEVLSVVLHEAAHALACARGIKDTSRQGRYHNKHFKACAEQLGLAAEHDQRNGWSASKITHHAEHAYASCCPSLNIPMKAALVIPMWGCGKAPRPGWLRGLGGGGAGGRG